MINLIIWLPAPRMFSGTPIEPVGDSVTIYLRTPPYLDASADVDAGAAAVVVAGMGTWVAEGAGGGFAAEVAGCAVVAGAVVAGVEAGCAQPNINVTNTMIATSKVMNVLPDNLFFKFHLQLPNEDIFFIQAETSKYQENFLLLETYEMNNRGYRK